MTPVSIALADADTRERLVTAASELFAENGFRKVTVRDICTAAGANVAAVNYHFGDKLGLYREVLERAIAAQQSLTEAARKAGEGLRAEAQLAEFVRVFVGGAQHRPTWVRSLLFREMSDPTPALDEIVQRGVRPRLEYSVRDHRGVARRSARGSADRPLRGQRDVAADHRRAEPDRRTSQAWPAADSCRTRRPHRSHRRVFARRHRADASHEGREGLERRGA